MDPPLIGVPGRARPLGPLAPAEFAAYGELEVELYFAGYARWIARSGGLPVHLPLEADPGALVRRLDGLVLSGGADIDPHRYGRPRDEDASIDPRRDDFEIGLVEAAESLGVPVLAICRGFQLVNVMRGGSLHRHVPVHARYDAPVSAVHDVHLADGSLLHELLGPSVCVNSMHHQTIDELGTGVVPVGWSPDGAIEAGEVGDGLLAVQWHPEKLDSRSTSVIFRWIVEVAAARR